MYGNSSTLTNVQKNQNHKQQQQKQQQPKLITPTLGTAVAPSSIPTTTTPPSHTRQTTARSIPATITKSNSCQQLNSSSAYSTCSVLTPTKVADPSLIESCNPAISTHMTLFSHRRRRFLQRHACILSILVAFIVGLILGVLAPMLGMSNFFTSISTTFSTANIANEPTLMTHLPILSASEVKPLQPSTFRDNGGPTEIDPTINETHRAQLVMRPPSDFPTIYGLQATLPLGDNSPQFDTEIPPASPYSVAFVKEQSLELSAKEVFRNAFQFTELKDVPNTMLVKKLDMEDGSVKQFRVERLGSGRFRKGPEKRLSKPNLKDKSSQGTSNQLLPLAERIIVNTQTAKQYPSIIKSDIYWGDIVERALPQGFSEDDAKSWNSYVTSKGIVTRFEPGCGRMQNRLVIFADGQRACARYRQNTDQIQGEIFSFYLGQLLNITNLAPSAATVVDVDSQAWSTALPDITQAQWKQQRPVVLTRWLPDLEPAGIPKPFQPLERHLNKYDVWNITLGGTPSTHLDAEQGLRRQRFGNRTQRNQSPSSSSSSSSSSASSSSTLTSASSATLPLTTIQPTPAVLQRLVELAQWSDLIVFDYLIANLDRVVNNLYNFQWNADIMAAPAHNLARQIDTQLLVFLDNESGLLHGYRLLKKYEAYHGLLLDNLCIFRQPTIDALRQLRADGAGRKLREIFEHTTSNAVRDVLPSLPDKSIKILVERIDRVLGQVQKCKDLLSDR